MPCPEKFRDSLEVFKVDKSIKDEILDGYETLVSSSKKIKKAEFFKRALDIMDAKLEKPLVREIFEWNACCKSGARDKASKEFARINKGLPLEEKLAKIRKAPYMNMGSPELVDGALLIHAVSYEYEGKYACACGTFRRSGYKETVSKHYCWCCGGHFRYHYEKMLDVKLGECEVVSSPLDSGGEKACVFRFEMESSEE